VNTDRTDQASPGITYYFWLLSDWAYLGGLRLEAIARRHGVAIEYVPLRLPEVYARTGGILLGQRAPQRQAYRVAELKRWRERLGMRVNIEPKYFPVDVDLASCVIVAAIQAKHPVGALAQRFLEALWAEDRDISDPVVVAAIVGEEGLDPQSLLRKSEEDDVRAIYQANTDRAVADGVFGSPFYIFDRQMFWGQDRLDMLEDAIVRCYLRDSFDLGRSPEP